MTHKTELTIIGAGPAGIEAAITASKCGIKDIMLIDAYPQPGGQYFKQKPVAFTSKDNTKLNLKGQEKISALNNLAIDIFYDTVVWGAYKAEEQDGWYLTLFGKQAPERVFTKTLIIASGAYDRPVAFPGWTLPGVVTAGAVQVQIKSQRVLPGKKCLLSGTGPLQLAVAAQLVQAGAEVVGLLESSPDLISRGIGKSFKAFGQWEKMQEGWGYWRTLSKAGVPIKLGWSVIEARGGQEVEEAVVARLDQNWKPIPGSEKTIAADTIVIGYGLTPATELTRLLDCQHTHTPEAGGYIPIRDNDLQTTQPGIFSVGDGAGIGGYALASVEGHIAALAAAQQLGYLSEADKQAARKKIHNKWTKEQRFASMLGELFTPKDGLLSLIDEETLVCRCEDVKFGKIKEAVSWGAKTIGEVKDFSRCGMGNCQGRICGEIIPKLMAAELGCSLEEVGTFKARPPIHPIPLSALIDAELH